MTSYQRLKERIERHERYARAVEKQLRDIIVDLLVLRYKQTGETALPLFGVGISGDDILTHVADDNFYFVVMDEVKQRIAGVK